MANIYTFLTEIGLEYIFTTSVLIEILTKITQRTTCLSANCPLRYDFFEVPFY